MEESCACMEPLIGNPPERGEKAYATRGQYEFFPLDSCSALSPSSPSRYYWIRTSAGSAVRMYCGLNMSCGEAAGGWRRVAELNSSQECKVPSKSFMVTQCLTDRCAQSPLFN